jgi:signal transduction histidine kinase
VIKEAFVRYIYHQLGTPLNTIKLGIEYLIVHANDTTSLHGRCIKLDITRGMRDACNTTKDILEDMITHDRIEHGILHMRKILFGAKSILDSCFTELRDQVRRSWLAWDLLICS